jgi:hypothetical protein
MSSLTLRLTRLTLISLLALTLCPSLAAGARSQPAEMGVLAGSVSFWPGAPVEQRGRPAPRRPAPGVKLMIYGPGRQEIAAVTTDQQGEFRLPLPSGTYRVEMAPLKGRLFTKDLPASVVITPGRETRLPILLDTGLR